jgi:hypothetical protein
MSARKQLPGDRVTAYREGLIETMTAVNPASPTMTSESLWPRVAGLPLIIEACEYDRLHAVLAYEFERITTHVRLVGAGADGLGEDVSVFREDGTALHETRPSLPLEGESTLAGFCDHLATLELWPEPPEWDVALRLRNWAFESAALDLALRQAGRSLHDVLGLEPQPVRFVNSLGLGKEPSIEPVRRRLARTPGVRFKLDAEATWAPELVDEVAATGAVDTVDFKGQYGFEVEDREALGALYDQVLAAFPDAYLEGPARPARDRAAARRSPRARVLRLADPQRRGHRRDAAGRARGERQAVADRQPAPALRGLCALRAGTAADVRRRHGRAGRGPRADRAARRAVPRRRAQRRGAERLQRGRPAGRPAGQPAGAAPRGHRLPLGGVDAHGARGWLEREEQSGRRRFG